MKPNATSLRKCRTHSCMAVVALLMCAAGARAQVSDTQIPLNYNFHGYAHAGETVTSASNANADVINFRSITPLVSGLGMYWDHADANAWGTNAIIGTTGITYNLFDALGYGNTTAATPDTYGLDSVHLGTRVFYGGMETTANDSTILGNATGWAPIFNVTALSSDSSTISGTTDVAHGLVAGQRVNIAGANPVAFSGAFTVATASGTNFTLTPVVGAIPNAGAATGSIFCNSTSTPLITALSASGTTVTATTIWNAANNNPAFNTGLKVNITGSSIAGYNGLYTLPANAPNPGTTFTYTDSNAPTGTPTGTQIYLATCDHTGEQTTTLASPVYLDANAEIGVLASASDNSGEFEVVLNFNDATSVSAWVALSPWTGAANPPIISDKVSAVSLISGSNAFRSVKTGDTAILNNFGTNNIQVGESIISVPKFAAAGINIVGKRLSSITFRNPFFSPAQITALSVSGGIATATVVQQPGYVPGMPIRISGVLSTNAGNVREFDGDYTVDSLVGTTQFRFKTSASGTPSAKMFATAPAGTVQVSAITTSGTTATVTTAAPHGFAVGDSVSIEGASNGTENGTYTIFTTPSTTTFTYTTLSMFTTPSAQMQVTRSGFGRGYQVHAVSVRSGPQCGTADFNCDGDLGTDSDIAAFFACLAGACPPPPCASTADFNGDGDLGTDSDIEAFFRVLGGGPCL